MPDSIAWLILPFGAWFLLIAILGVSRGYIPTQASALVKSRTVYQQDEPYVFWFNVCILSLQVRLFVSSLFISSLSSIIANNEVFLFMKVIRH